MLSEMSWKLASQEVSAEISTGDQRVGNGRGEHRSLGTKVQLRQASIGVSHPKQLACVFHHSICLTLREPVWLPHPSYGYCVLDLTSP